MHSYFKIKILKDDYLYWIFFISETLYKNRIYRIARIFTLIFDASLLILTSYFFITVFEFGFLSRYIATFLAGLSSVIFNGCALWSEKHFQQIQKVTRNFWSADSTYLSTEKRIKTEAKHLTIVAIFNAFLGVAAGFVVIPIGNEQDYQFPLVFSKKYLSYGHYIFCFLYCITLPVNTYLITNTANLTSYYIYIAKGQVLMCVDVFRSVSVGYEYENDDILLASKEYQKIVKERFLLVLIKHKELLQIARIANSIASQLLPWLSLGAVIMGTGFLSYFFTVNLDLGFWKYIQNIVWFVAAGVTGALFIQSGQELEGWHEAVVDSSHFVRWPTFNKSNRKIFLIILSMCQKPSKIEFTRKVSLNYALGLKIVKCLYSFIAIFIKVRQYY